MAPLALIPQMLFSGLFVPVQKIPQSLQWVKYLCPLKYAINLLTVVEFAYVKDTMDDCESKSSVPACKGLHPGDYLRDSLIKNQGVEWEDTLQDVVILGSLFCCFRIIAGILLWRKGKYVF